MKLNWMNAAGAMALWFVAPPLARPIAAQVAAPVAAQRTVPITAAPASPDSVLPPTRPSLARVGITSVAGAILGAGAGYAMAAVRCGRTRTCTPTESYPYIPAGAVIGSAVGGAIAGDVSGCRWALLRSVAGAAVGSFAGSLIGRSDLQQRRAGASAGALLGTVASVATCRVPRT